MAHQINFDEKTGTYSFASYGQTAWHGLGQVVENAMTAEEAIKLANLDYHVAKSPILVGDTGLEIPEKFATYRADTKEPLGVVGKNYEIVQNTEAFGFFDSIIDKGEAIFETAGVLGVGEKIFVTAKLPEDFLVAGEPCHKYILLTNSHDGSSSIICGFTAIRVVCNNTLQASLKGMQNKVSIRHKGNAREKLSEAYKVLKIASKYMIEIEESFNQMAKVNISDDGLKKYIEHVMKPEIKMDEEYSTRFKNVCNSIFEFAKTHPTQNTKAADGTVWGAYNAVSGYFNHVVKYDSQEVKFKKQLFGMDSKRIIKGFDIAMQLI
jgi:phage/plasmid-like protein (TIGR03299 family)